MSNFQNQTTMKSFTILLLFISFTFSLSAQRSEKSQFKQHFLSQGEIPKGIYPKETSLLTSGKSFDRETMIGREKSLKNATDLKQLLDSIVRQKYDTITNKWTPNSKDVFIFNEDGSPHQYKGYDWDPDTKKYKQIKEEDYEYNFGGDITSYTELTDMNGMMVNSYHETYEYDEQGRPKTYTEYNWDKDKSEWVEYYRQEYTYDSFGRDSTYTEFTFNDTSQMMEKDYKEEYSYNSNFLLDTYTGYNWNATDEKWVEQSMGTYNYFENGKPETITLSIRFDSTLEKYSQELYTYNDAGQVLTYIYARWVAEQWVNYYKYVYAYNSYNLILLQSLFIWNSGDWQKNYRIEYSYTEDKLLSIIYSNWDATALVWLYFYKSVYTLNVLYSYLNLIIPPWISQDYYRYMVLNYVYSLWIANKWVQFENNIYYYSSLNTTSANTMNPEMNLNLRAYPNPTSGYINFKWNGAYDRMKVKFYDAIGNLVLNKNVYNNSRLNVEQLNKGIYFYRLENNNQQMGTGKIIIK